MQFNLIAQQYSDYGVRNTDIMHDVESLRSMSNKTLH